MTNVINSILAIHNHQVPYFDPSTERIRWRKIPGFPFLKASSVGSIKNLETGKFLDKYKSKKGYINVSYKRKLYRLHRLIALAFHPNPKNLPQVNHKNGVKDFNFACNLEWCDNSYNQVHAINILGYKNRLGIRPVNVIKEGVIVFSAISVSEAARYLGCESSQMSQLCNGKIKHYKGYKCEYA